MEVRFAGVSKTYAQAGTAALRQVDLSIPAGAWAFIVGPSGAGKSTLLKLAYKALTPDEGRVLIGGRDIAGTPAFRLRRELGIIFQSFELLPAKTALENVRYGAEILGLAPRQAASQARQLLERVGLADKLHRFPGELSGGEQQRVAIARALINRPRLILADEPTGDLDPDNAARVMEILEAIHRDWRATVVIVTHAVEIVRRMRRRVIRIERGRIVSDGELPR